MDLSQHLVLFDIPDAEAFKFLADVAKGDPRCRYKVGDLVYKYRNEGPDEINPEGTMGTIKGSWYKDEPIETPWGPEHEMYLVAFVASVIPLTACPGGKIRKYGI